MGAHASAIDPTSRTSDQVERRDSNDKRKRRGAERDTACLLQSPFQPATHDSHDERETFSSSPLRCSLRVRSVWRSVQRFPARAAKKGATMTAKQILGMIEAIAFERGEA